MVDYTLNYLTIGNYITKRIGQNHKWYHQHIDDNAFNSYQDSRMQNNLYHILYVVMNRLFLNGDTLFWLSQNSVDFIIPSYHNNDNQQTHFILMPDWQYQILIVLCDEFFLLLRKLDKSANISFIYDKIFLLNECSDKENFVQLSRQYIQDFEQEISEFTHDKTHKNALLQIFQLIFRFFYCSRFVFFDLKVFYEYLKNSHFCKVFDNKILAFESFFVLTKFDGGQERFGIWLNRAFMAEYGLSESLKNLIDDDYTIDNKDCKDNPKYSASHYVLDERGLSDEQKNAVLSALKNKFSIITGGPGTGKTFTVAKLVLTLFKNEPNIRLALTAPTGKAAQRMQESLQQSLGQADYVLPEAKTIHRLIGLSKSGISRHNANNPIDADIVIVDEASMLGIELACQLFSAVKKNARLVLLGDIHQLSAVEAGAVLSDLCHLPKLTSCHQQLTISRRFVQGSSIDTLANLIHNANNENNDESFDGLMNIVDNFQEISYDDINKMESETIYESMSREFQSYFEKCIEFFDEKLIDVQLLFNTFGKYRILTATHIGIFGDCALNDYIAKQHLSYYQDKLPKECYQKGGEWYHGRAVMIIKNAYDLGLFNGDIGICVAKKNKDGREFMVYFENRSIPIPISLLSEQGLLSNAYAMTIHKSQGSEFEKVAICFDDKNTQILGKELFYTAITRAKESIALYSHKNAIILAMTQQSERQTGLGLLFNERLLNNDK